MLQNGGKSECIGKLAMNWHRSLKWHKYISIFMRIDCSRKDDNFPHRGSVCCMGKGRIRSTSDNSRDVLL
jgi:hypothetical protein